MENLRFRVELGTEERERKKWNLIHQARGEDVLRRCRNPFFFFALFSEWGRLEANYRDKEWGGGKEGRGGRRIGEDGSEASQAPGAFDASHYGNATSRGS